MSSRVATSIETRSCNGGQVSPTQTRWCTFGTRGPVHTVASGAVLKLACTAWAVRSPTRWERGIVSAVNCIRCIERIYQSLLCGFWGCFLFKNRGSISICYPLRRSPLWTNFPPPLLRRPASSKRGPRESSDDLKAKYLLAPVMMEAAAPQRFTFSTTFSSSRSLSLLCSDGARSCNFGHDLIGRVSKIAPEWTTSISSIEAEAGRAPSRASQSKLPNATCPSLPSRQAPHSRRPSKRPRDQRDRRLQTRRPVPRSPSTPRRVRCPTGQSGRLGCARL